MLRAQRNLLFGLLVCTPLSWLACSKPEPPPPTPAAEEDEKPEKKKKKKKEEEPEDKTEVGAPSDEPTSGTAKPPIGLPTAKPATTDAGGGGSAADKAKLAACCTALRNAAAAAGIVNAAPSVLPPGVPAPPPPPKKEELEKAAKECDTAVNNWNGDLNNSLKKVKGASTAVLPSACMIVG